MSRNPHEPDIALVLPFPCWGGVETAFLHLARYFSNKGLKVDVVFSSNKGQLLEEFQKCATVFNLNNIFIRFHYKERYAFLDYPKIRQYVLARNPRSLLAAKSVCNYCVARLKKELDYPGKVVISEHLDVKAGKKALNPVQRFVANRLESYYRYADAAVGVAKAVSRGLIEEMRLPAKMVYTIYNPIITDKIFPLAEEKPAHKWLNPKPGRVILGVGRLTAQKDFENLIRAFRIVVNRFSDCYLIILGDGPDRQKLERLVDKLRLTDRVDLPGYALNPYPYMKNADLFVLSSRYEGLGIVLVEALALGTQVVATDCPCGPAEILNYGRFGRLVPIEDSDALAQAIIATLNNPQSTAEQVRWAREVFSVETAAEKYLTLLLGEKGS